MLANIQARSMPAELWRPTLLLPVYRPFGLICCAWVIMWRQTGEMTPLTGLSSLLIVLSSRVAATFPKRHEFECAI